jgi:hypothetical protein
MDQNWFCVCQKFTNSQIQIQTTLALKPKSFYHKMLRLGAGRSSVRQPAEARLCVHLCRPSLLFSKYTGIKRMGRECGHPSPADAHVNDCSYTTHIMCHAWTGSEQPIGAAVRGCSTYRLTSVHMQNQPHLHANSALPFLIRHNLSPVSSTTQKFNYVS